MNWIFMICLSCTMVGFWLYMYEVIQGNIDRFTRWSELDENGLTAAALVLGGGLGMIITIAVAVILKGQS